MKQRLAEKVLTCKESKTVSIKILKMFALYAIICILQFALLSLFSHIRLFSGQLYFFRLFTYAALGGLIILIGFIAMRKHDIQLIISGVIISILMVFIFISIFLAVIDRSYSVFSLAHLVNNSEQSYTMKEIEDNFIENYVVGLDATKRRVDEQVRIGNLVEVEEGKYQIAPKGARLIKTFRFFEKIFPVEEKRILYGFR
jgi:hypothetical protein